jgi:transposase
MSIVEFPQIVERGCGLDVHKETVVATVKGTDILERTVTFGTFTEELEQLAGFLQNEGVTHIAMESTGVYWKPVYYILEDYFTILLVNARHIKNVPGHKTDKKDSEWIAKLLLSGLLKGSFVPRQEIRELRVLNRHRRKLVGQRTAEKNRLQNILEDANIKLGSVLSDVFGKSGMAIINAIAQGQTDPEQLSQLAKGSLVRKKQELKRSLYGKTTDHHRFMIRLILDSIEHINRQILHIEDQMDLYLTHMKQDVNLLMTIPGVSKQIAAGILSEVGNDMEPFATHKHLASWAGVCPGNNESAGKKKSSKITHGNKYLKTTLVEAAWAASRSRTNPLSIKHKNISGRRGRKKANIAIGHKILTAAYFTLRDKTPYLPYSQDPGIVRQRRLKNIERLEKQLAKLKNASLN